MIAPFRPQRKRTIPQFRKSLEIRIQTSTNHRSTREYGTKCY